MAPEHASAVIVEPARHVCGKLRVPGDKSISHRYAILASLADGATSIEGYAPGADCASTVSCLRALGVSIESTGAAGNRTFQILGRSLRGLQPSRDSLDAQNSGTTARLLMGVLAAHPFDTTLTGDASLRRRPMRRVAAPLEHMGARIVTTDGRLPVTVIGARLRGIDYSPEVASAQVKSAVLLAGLQADGVTIVREPASTRDHTERALRAFGADVGRDGLTVLVRGNQRLRGLRLAVPGDISSAAFWATAAAALPGSELELLDVGLNPTRVSLVAVLQRYGASVETTIEREEAGEPCGRIVVRHAGQMPLVIAPEEVPGLIDELPVLAALATHGGSITVTGAGELRAKESDRITALVDGLRALGASADERTDGFHVRATGRLRGGTADAAGDHRLAMAFAIAALGAERPSTILGSDAVDVSYPGFFNVLKSISE